MKITFAVATAALVLAACGGAETPAADTPGAAAPAVDAPVPAETPAAAAMPTGLIGPAAGKWMITSSTGTQELPVFEICYEEDLTMEAALKMQQQAGITCSEQSIAPDGKSGHSVCTVMGVTITSDFSIVGDFTSAYTMETHSTMIPEMPVAPNPIITTASAQRTGDCTADTPRIPVQ